MKIKNVFNRKKGIQSSFLGGMPEPVRVQTTGLTFPAAIVTIGRDLSSDNVYLLKDEELNALIAMDAPAAELKPVLRDMAGTLSRYTAYTAARKSGDETDEKLKQLENNPSTPKEENALQSPAEAIIQQTPALVDKVKEALTLPDACAKLPIAGFDVTKTLKIGGMERPITTKTFQCVHNNVVAVQLVTFAYNDLFGISKSGGKIIFESYETSIDDFRSIYINQISESTKISFGLTYSMFPQLDPDLAPEFGGGKVQVKEGEDTVHQDGQPKKDSAGGTIGFNLDYMKQYYELTIRAEARFKLVHKVKDRYIVEMG